MSESSQHRILYVSAVSQIGGAEKSLLDILDCLDREKFEPFVALPGDGPLVDGLKSRGISTAKIRITRFKKTLNPFKLGGYPASWKVGIRELGQAIDHFDANLIHANGDIAQLFSYPAADKRDIPLIWHVRDLSPNRLIRWKMGQHVTRVIAISTAVKEMLINTGVPEARIRLVLNGLDTSSFEALAPPSESCLSVGMIAHLYPWKGHKDFLHAAALVRKEIPEATFTIAGEDILNDQTWYREELKQLTGELGLDDAVVFAGAVDNIAEFVDNIAVLAVPSHGEPFGRCVVEGLAAARPVVSWNVGGPSEIINHDRTGILIEPYDIHAFAQAIVRLLKNRKEALDMGVAGRTDAVSRFHRQRTVEEIQRIYEEVLR